MSPAGPAQSEAKPLDVTLPVHSGLVTWPGEQRPLQTWHEQMAKGGDCDVTSWTLSSHAGTHVDAPAHYIAGGRTIDEIEPTRLVGPATVVALPHDVRVVTAGVLRAAWPTQPTHIDRLLIRTGNSARCYSCAPFDPDYAHLDGSAAAYLVDHGLLTVGFDYISIEAPDGRDESGAVTYPVHRQLLGADIPIVEGLDLSEVRAGSYWLCCLPLRLRGCEAAPARAVLYPSPDATPRMETQ